jgi:hypothetical protein
MKLAWFDLGHTIIYKERIGSSEEKLEGDGEEISYFTARLSIDRTRDGGEPFELRA